MKISISCLKISSNNWAEFGVFPSDITWIYLVIIYVNMSNNYMYVNCTPISEELWVSVPTLELYQVLVWVQIQMILYHIILIIKVYGSIFHKLNKEVSWSMAFYYWQTFSFIYLVKVWIKMFIKSIIRVLICWTVSL